MRSQFAWPGVRTPTAIAAKATIDRLEADAGIVGILIGPSHRLYENSKDARASQQQASLGSHRDLESIRRVARRDANRDIGYGLSSIYSNR